MIAAATIERGAGDDRAPTSERGSEHEPGRARQGTIAGRVVDAAGAPIVGVTVSAETTTEPAVTAIDAAGDVYVADTTNSAIRKVTPAGEVTTIAGTPGASGIVLGTTPRLVPPVDLTIVGDAIVIVDTYAVLVLHHGALSCSLPTSPPACRVTPSLSIAALTATSAAVVAVDAGDRAQC